MSNSLRPHLQNIGDLLAEGLLVPRGQKLQQHLGLAAQTLQPSVSMFLLVHLPFVGAHVSQDVAVKLKDLRGVSRNYHRQVHFENTIIYRLDTICLAKGLSRCVRFCQGHMLSSIRACQVPIAACMPGWSKTSSSGGSSSPRKVR